MPQHPPGPPGPPVSNPPHPDYDLHQLTVMVDQLEVASNLYRTTIQHLTTRVAHLEDLLAGRVIGDVRIEGTLTAKGDVRTEGTVTATDVLLP